MKEVFCPMKPDYTFVYLASINIDRAWILYNTWWWGNDGNAYDARELYQMKDAGK